MNLFWNRKTKNLRVISIETRKQQNKQFGYDLPKMFVAV